jgi:hypothetical protein
MGLWSSSDAWTMRSMLIRTGAIGSIACHYPGLFYGKGNNRTSRYLFTTAKNAADIMIGGWTTTYLSDLLKLESRSQHSATITPQDPYNDVTTVINPGSAYLYNQFGQI